MHFCSEIQIFRPCEGHIYFRYRVVLSGLALYFLHLILEEKVSESAFVAIAGNMGVGKTTLTKLLHDRFGWKTFYEPQARNPYLEDFYKDMPRWAFHSQIFFLTQRFKDHLAIQSRPEVSIQDRTIYEDAEIFATNLYTREMMPERDYLSYQSLYHAMVKSLKKPQIVIYLRASTWTLISRIRKRGRSYERDVDVEYLAQLNICYENWIKKIADHWNLLVVDTDNFDMFEDVAWLDGILDEIGERI